MIILGIDPAIRCTGYGVIDIRTPDEMYILDCGVISNKPGVPHSECLRRLSGGIRELIVAFNPDCASIEDAFFGKNIKTSMILSMARGAIIAALAEAGVPVYPYAPRKAKRSTVGTGTASKTQVGAMMAVRFGINVSEIPDDATDALALALCHGQVAITTGMECLLPPPV
jgi:crossover junction endodeoxyribonuclease RuvC